MSSPADASYLRFFPFEEPYDHQAEAMATIASALGDGRTVLFEGATGTGKTLAALAPALEEARRTDKTVVITTNVHQQMRQFVREARAITRQEAIRAVVFKGKASMCHLDVGYEECQALRDTTRELVGAERERADLAATQRSLLADGQAGTVEAADARAAVMDELETVEAEIAELTAERATCDHYYRNLTADTEAFYSWLFDDVRTPDDVYDYAEQAGLCGYELLKEGMDGVDLVVCNYHHLLDPSIRAQFFRWLGRDPSDVIAVFDEAHNVADAARDHARRTLTETTLDRAVDELEGVADPRREAGLNVVRTYRDALQATYEAALTAGNGGDDRPPTRAQVDESWHDLAIDNEAARDDLTLAFLRRYEGPGVHEELERALDLGQELDREYEEAYKSGDSATRQECQTLRAARFVETWLEESAVQGQYPVVSVRRQARPAAESTDRQATAAHVHTTATASDDPDTADDTDATATASDDPDTADDADATATASGDPDTADDADATATASGDPDTADDADATATASGDPDTAADEVTQRAAGDIYGRAELYTCIPRSVTGELFGDLFASVLMSATLRPFDVTEDVLGLADPKTLAYGPQFPAEHRRTYAVDVPALFASRRDDRAVQETVTAALEDAIRFTPGNVLAFFPSYAEAERYHERLSVRVPTYLDEPATSAASVRNSFAEETGAVLCTSLWGTLGEGVSFDGDDARTVVVVGVPYPHLDGRMAAVQSAYHAAFDGADREAPSGRRADEGAGWRYAVEIPTVRKTRQAVGRVVRAPDDYGARILLDGRYTERAEVEMPEYAVRGTFPPEERREMVDVEAGKLKFGLLNFFRDLDAYEGEPPTP